MHDYVHVVQALLVEANTTIAHTSWLLRVVEVLLGEANPHFYTKS